MSFTTSHQTKPKKGNNMKKKLKSKRTTNRMKSREIANYFSDNPFKMSDFKVRIEYARKNERIDELKTEINLYRDALSEIRELALFGRISKDEKQISGSIFVRSEIGNRSWDALNWADQAQEQV